MEIDEANDTVQLTTFKARLESREFVVALAKSPPQMMAKMLLKAQKYINAEDALATIEDEGKTRERERGGEKKKTGGDIKEKGETARVLMEISGEKKKLRW